VEQHERSGVLVLRVWTEPQADVPLRAKITAERDLNAAGRTEVAAAGLPEIVDVVRAWLEEFAEPAGG
jgi:hypothetical protein